MGIEAETTGPSIADTQLVPASSNGTTKRKPEAWRRRSFQITAGLVALAMVAAVIADAVITRQFTADGAVRQYLSALQSGDTSGAWNAIQISALTQPVGASFTNQAALQAALSTGKPDIKSFAISSDTQIDSSTTVVAFAYDTSTGSKEAKAVVQRSGQTHFGIYPVWHLLIAPTLLQVTLPTGSDGVSIDGKEFGLPQGTKSTIAVLPLAHKMQLDGTQMLASQTITVDASFSLGQTVSFQPQLTPAGMDSARVAIKAFFNTCAQRTNANLDDGACPQGLTTYLSPSGQWHFVGDPTQDLTISFNKNLNVVGMGHFQAVFSYQESVLQGTQHVPSSGAYSAALVLSATDVAVASIQPASGPPALARPAGATDQGAEDLVAQALRNCAAVRSGNVADCPQAAPDVIISNVRWTLKGNPLSGATVIFDSTNGLFTVHGNFAMSVSYNWFGTHPKSGQSYITSYDARLFWDGKNYQLITIDGANS